MKRENKERTEIWVRLKGCFDSWNTHCQTLKEVMETYPSCEKRSWIGDWYRRPVGAEENDKPLLL